MHYIDLIVHAYIISNGISGRKHGYESPNKNSLSVDFIYADVVHQFYLSIVWKGAL